jgi:hypothetical protein
MHVTNRNIENLKSKYVVLQFPLFVCEIDNFEHSKTGLFEKELLQEYNVIQLFQLRLSTSKAEKSNTSAKGCWESL